MAANPEATMNAVEALKLKLQGYTYREIAEKLNISNPGTVHHAVQRVLQRTAQEPADELRQLESLRLDRLQVRLLEMLEASDQPLFVIDRILKVMSQRAQLLGLNKPVVVEDDLGDQLASLIKRVAQRYKEVGDEPADPDAAPQDA